MIKQLLIFVPFLFLSAQTQAQTSAYYRFPDSAATWNESVHWYNDTCDWNEFYTLFINGDTTVNSNTYQKLFETGYRYSAICDTTIYFHDIYAGGLRQNALLKEVYIMPPGDTTTMLLYDFNLTPGDTLPATYEGQSNYNDVLSVDSVLIGSDYRKVFAIGLLDSTYSYTSLIEGIGSTLGLIVPVTPPAEYSYSLLCFSENGQTLYSNSASPDSSTSCGLLSGVNELSPKSLFNIYPNPATNRLSIHSSVFQQTGDFTVTITNVLGQEMHTNSLSFEGGGSEVLDVHNLSPGMYFLQIITKKQRWAGRFIKS